MNIKYAFYNLSRRPIFTLLIIFQLVISLMLCYISVSYKNYISVKTEKYNKAFSDKNFYTLLSNSNSSISSIDTTSYEKFSKYLNSSSDFQFIPLIDDSIYIKDFPNSEKFIKAYMDNVQDNVNLVLVRDLTVNNKFFDNFDFKLSRGRSFDNKDYNLPKGEAIPVILGDSYSNIFKIGEEIPAMNGGEKCTIRVVGFLEKGYYFSGANYLQSMATLDECIISPLQTIKPEIVSDSSLQEDKEGKYKVDLLNEISGGFILFNKKDSKYIHQAINKINTKAEEFGLSFKITGVDQTISKFVNENKQQETITMVLFVIIVGFSAVGIVSSMLYHISKQKKEFGIHIMHGGTIGDITKRIIYEIGMYMGFSYIIAISIIMLFLANDPALKFTFVNFIMNTIIVIVLGMLICIIPVINILRLQVNNLVRGNE